MKNKKILHILPDSVNNINQFYLGSTKDIRGRTEYFQSRSLEYEELFILGRNDEYLLSVLKEKDLSSYHAIFYELPMYPRSLAYIRQKHPTIKQITRSINADFYHRLHYYWGALIYSKGWLLPVYIFIHRKWFFSAFEKLRLDYACARESNFILAITDWEKQNYWRYLAPRKKLRTLPYYLPNMYTKEAFPASVKKDQCLCLMSSTVKTLPILQDALHHFSQLVHKLGNECPDWRFYATGDLSKVGFPIARRILKTGLLETPFPLLAESRAMANLSNFGFGFKTKLLDAIQNGCYTLVPQKLYYRLPEEIKPFCIVVNLGSVKSFEEALEDSKRPFPEGDPNARFKERAFSVLDEILAG